MKNNDTRINIFFVSISLNFNHNNFFLFEWTGMEQFHKNKKHNNRRASVLIWFYIVHIHKNIDMHLLAFLLLFDARNVDRL